MRGLAVALLLLAGCREESAATSACPVEGTVAVTVTRAAGAHRFCVEVARTADEQARGLMYRTDVPVDGGMLFAPYPPEGGAPKEASFWMENTPSALDIIFIRADGTIARIGENAVPFDRTPVVSSEPVTAVLELRGGRAAELGIGEGDRVAWSKAAVEGGTGKR